MCSSLSADRSARVVPYRRINHLTLRYVSARCSHSTFNRLMCDSGPDEQVSRKRTLPVLSADGSQDFPAGGSGGDGGAGGCQGGRKGEPRRPPPEPEPFLGQLAHAGGASSLTATFCLPQVGQSKRETLVFKRIRCAQSPARICACNWSHTRGPVRAPRSVVSRKSRA